MSLKSFKNKTILITGAANGIGKELARLFAKDGTTLILWDKDENSLDSLQFELTKLNDDCEVHYNAFDLLDDQKLKIALNGVSHYGGIQYVDIIINNAGVGLNKKLLDTREDEWSLLNNLNFEVPRKIINDLINKMPTSGKRQIVNVSSGQSFFLLPSWGAYAVTKRALAAYSELLAIELLDDGIDVLTVYPFMSDTGFYKGMEEKAGTWAGKMSMKLLPYYSNKPETVALKIYRAIQKGKIREFVHPLNYVGYYLDTIPVVGDITRLIANVLLNK